MTGEIILLYHRDLLFAASLNSSSLYVNIYCHIISQWIVELILSSSELRRAHKYLETKDEMAVTSARTPQCFWGKWYIISCLELTLLLVGCNCDKQTLWAQKTLRSFADATCFFLFLHNERHIKYCTLLDFFYFLSSQFWLRWKGLLTFFLITPNPILYLFLLCVQR